MIYDGRNNPNCDESETLCYNTIREYFTVYPSELGTACKELYARNRFDMDLEQSTIRIRLCQEVDASSISDVAPSCEPLVTQVSEIKNQNPLKACSAFGLGPGTQELPTASNSNCGVTTTNGADTASKSGSHSTHSRRRRYDTLLAGLIAFMFMSVY